MTRDVLVEISGTYMDFQQLKFINMLPRRNTANIVSYAKS